ncbi:hypothetical protein [Iodidimonas sp. SYSU 1G8]|uniref:hypothetical protein n=1 Tax=Iodidimonas sp. SYSU 1G8 TaxID=3133967 RepID=UPI0031FEC9C5
MQTKTMKNVVTKMLISLRKVPLLPTGERYQPEKHYMRGPGPACAAKARLSQGAPQSG